MKEDLNPDQKLNKPLSWIKPVGPLNERIGNQDFIALCESVRFKLDKPTSISRSELLNKIKGLESNHSFALGNSLRIHPQITPSAFKFLATCSERLHRPTPPETFIKSGNGKLNACCWLVSPQFPQWIEVYGELFNILDEDEILAVIGHEMGHMALHTASSNSGELEEGYTTRAMEISADRVGLLACLKIESALKLDLKLATGLHSKQILVDMKALMQQGSEISRHHDGWQSYQGHPFLPFRLWALQRFSETDRFQTHIGEPGGLAFDEVEQEITARFEMIGGGTIHVNRADRLNETLIWLSTLLIAELRDVSSRSRLELEHLIGRIRAEQALDLLSKCGKEEIKVRAEIWTHEIISEATAAELTKDLESLAVAIGVDLKTTEAWVVLAEAKAKKTTTDDGDD
jgi:hypothetical protein